MVLRTAHGMARYNAKQEGWFPAHDATDPWFCSWHMAGVYTTRFRRATFRLATPHIHDVAHNTWLEYIRRKAGGLLSGLRHHISMVLRTTHGWSRYDSRQEGWFPAHDATDPWFRAQFMSGLDTTWGRRGTFRLTTPHIHGFAHDTLLD